MPLILVKRPAGTLEVPCPEGQSLLAALEGTDCLPRADCGGRGVCGLCRITVAVPAALPPTGRERATLPPQAIARGLRLACQAKPLTDITVFVAPGPARGLWTEIGDLPPPLRPPEQAGGAGLGIAIDLGSTNIRASLLDLDRGRRLAAVLGHNPQRRYGSDILTRIARARDAPEAARRMQEETRRALGEAIAALFARDVSGAARRSAVTRVRLVGNTAVLSLLAGDGFAALLDPESWNRRLPCGLGDPGPWRRAWRLDDGADLALCGPLGGFIGSDLTAGVIGSGLTRAPAPALLIDFGTNTEIALWDGTGLLAAAAAGGPAFEGSGISSGAPAGPGAVHRVTWSAAAERPELAVIGGGAPLGLCGSGLVDAVAGLRRAGLLSASGRMDGTIPRSGFAFTDGADGLRLSRSDIDVFQRAKAAVAAGAAALLRRAGVTAADLCCVMVSGVFGRHLDPLQAQAIGLLPSTGPGRTVAVADSALRGCERLLAAEGAALQAALERQVRTINLAGEADYEELFIDHLKLAPF
ncbi:MAG: ASKHA domain-containing protein [Rhodospirillaceae bacterium]